MTGAASGRPVQLDEEIRDRIIDERHDGRLWVFQSCRNGFQQDVTLQLYWEVNGDPITDNYLVEDISAADLLDSWRSRYVPEDGYVAIYWGVRAAEADQGVFETVPFQKNWAGSEDFLTYFTWPTDDDNVAINWNELTVVDKLWRPTQTDKGGFFQEATRNLSIACCR